MRKWPKSRSYLATVALLLTFFSFMPLVFASIPRWPEPAWFAQFAATPAPAEPLPATEPGTVTQPSAEQPAPAPSPQPPTTPIPRWPQPGWYQSGGTPAPAPAPAPGPVASPGSGSQNDVAGISVEERRLFDLVNAERRQRGIPELILDPTLSELAAKKSQDMVDNRYFGHTSPTYGKVSDMLKSAGVRYIMAGENLAGAGSVGQAHAMMMDSSPHRNAILNKNYTQIGIGVVKDPHGGIKVTEIFVQPAK